MFCVLGLLTAGALATDPSATALAEFLPLEPTPLEAARTSWEALEPRSSVPGLTRPTLVVTGLDGEPRQGNLGPEALTTVMISGGSAPTVRARSEELLPLGGPSDGLLTWGRLVESGIDGARIETWLDGGPEHHPELRIPVEGSSRRLQGTNVAGTAVQLDGDWLDGVSTIHLPRGGQLHFDLAQRARFIEGELVVQLHPSGQRSIVYTLTR